MLISDHVQLPIGGSACRHHRDDAIPTFPDPAQLGCLVETPRSARVVWAQHSRSKEKTPGLVP
jgi:hypothetical protein